MLRVVLLVAACGWVFFTGAVQAQTTGTLDDLALSRPLTSPAAFDAASRQEILTFARLLADSDAFDEPRWRQQLGLPAVNMQVIAEVRQRFWRRLLKNYQYASESCSGAAAHCGAAKDLATFRQQAANFALVDGPTKRFQERYLSERMWLAAQFPTLSSEVAFFSPKERNGDELLDRQFLLTFDDGPTAVGGYTDSLLAYLRAQKLNGVFFVLGGNLQARLQATSARDLQQLYAGQCVGMHGWEHQSHALWDKWQESVRGSAALVSNTLPDSYVPLFRPPFGQRLADSPAFFAKQKLEVVLWNIEGQEWDEKVSAEDAAQRLLHLMLLWRRGVVLIHDIQPKTAVLLPWLVQVAKKSGMNWASCRRYPMAATPAENQ
jgi:peptidoglycan/xylan/chitin deacetylase (PgdA/CDA1 family)